jgi:ABC-2 type transport system permease protein
MGHELRLAWRGGEAKARWVRFLLFGALLLIMSGAGLPMGYVLRRHPLDLNEGAIIGTALGFGFILVMSFSTSLSFTAAGFIDRGDIELLLSSPLPMRRLLTVRLAATTVRSITLWLLLFGPPILAVACLAGPRWLNGILLLLDAGLIGTSISTWLAIVLFRILGRRQVKTTTTVITALSGLSMGFGPTLFNAHFGDAERAEKVGQFFDRAAALSFFSPESIGSLPARALLGEMGAALLLFIGALAFFLTTIALVAPSFATIATQAEAQRHRSAGTAPLRGFGGNLFRQLLVKNYRLLLRNHSLLLQILARTMAFIPLLVINLSHSGRSLDLAQIAGGVTLILGQAGGATVWAFIIAETQPDLLASSPHPAGLFRKSRLTAGLMPALILVVAAAVLMAGRSMLAGLAVLIMGTAACLSSAAINSMSRPVASRKSGGWNNAPRIPMSAQFTDFAGGFAWAAAAWCLANGSIWTPLPVWAGLSAVWLWRTISRRDNGETN